MSEPGNAKKDVLSTLLSDPDKTVKYVTLGLIIFSGGGNLLLTRNAEKTSTHEADRAIREIHDLHEELTAAMARQKEIFEYIKKKDQ
jgi:hypothetical protein